MIRHPAMSAYKFCLTLWRNEAPVIIAIPQGLVIVFIQFGGLGSWFRIIQEMPEAYLRKTNKMMIKMKGACSAVCRSSPLLKPWLAWPSVTLRGNRCFRPSSCKYREHKRHLHLRFSSIQNKLLRRHACQPYFGLQSFDPNYFKEKWEFHLVFFPFSFTGSVLKITAMSICRMPPKPKLSSLGRSQDALTKICLKRTFSSDLQTR